MTPEIIENTVAVASSYERLGIVGVSFILFIIMGSIAYFLLRKVLENFKIMENVIKNNKNIEEVLSSLKHEFQTNNEVMKHILEEQKNTNNLYQKIIEKSLVDMKIEIKVLKSQIQKNNYLHKHCNLDDIDQYREFYKEHL